MMAAIFITTTPLVTVHARELAADPLEGRLGGTYASFVERLGEPMKVSDQSGVFFAYPDANYLVVQLYTIGAYEPDDPVVYITVAAERDEARPADEIDPADWDWDTARSVAADVAPADAVFGASDDSVQGSISETCTSDALLEAFGVVSLGQCRATFLLSSPETISFVTLTLTAGAEMSPDEGSPEPACAGVVEWANSSAERLETAQTLLDSLATLSDDPAVAVPDLRALATSLDALADEQRSSDAPREVATANYYIIGALTDFSAAIDGAADGLEEGDQALVDEAVEDLDAADDRAARATTEIETAVTACDLTTGTPAPER